VYLREIKTRDSIELLVKNQEIKLLNKMLDSIKVRNNKNNFPFDKIAKEIRLNYGKVTDVSYAILLIDKNNRVDTIPTFRVSWDDDITLEQKTDFEDRLSNWLSFKMDMSEIDVHIIPNSILYN
jgi:sporulation protein YlmC with PRC-barrel domain